MTAARPTRHNRESRNGLTPFCVPSCVGAECAGAGAGAGNDDILDLFAIFCEELDAFLRDIGVVCPKFFGVESDSDLLPIAYEYFLPFFSVCLRQTCLSTTSVLRVEEIVGIGRCNTAI